MAADVLADALPAVPALVVALKVNHVVSGRPVVILVELELVAAQSCSKPLELLKRNVM